MKRESVAPDSDDVAVVQCLLSNRYAIHPRAIGGTEVDEHKGVRVRSKLGVASGNVGVVEIHGALWHTTDDGHVHAQTDAATIVQRQESGRCSGNGSLGVSGLGPEASRDELVVLDQGDPDASQEAEASALGVLSHRSDELETE